MRRELASYQEFMTVGQQIVEVNEAICDARPISAFAAEVARLAELAAGSVGVAA